MTAGLSYQDNFGYYGLRVNPSFSQLEGTVKKPWKIPVPDRHDKWYALGPYRAHLLDASNQYNIQQAKSLSYLDSGASLPEAATQTKPSDAMGDPSWMRSQNHNLEIDARELVDSVTREEHLQNKRETQEIRRSQLSSYGPNLTDATVENHHDDLEEASVPHAMPFPRPPMTRASWPSEHLQYAAAGIPQAPEFPSYEALNLSQRAVLNDERALNALRAARRANLLSTLGKSYENIRDEVTER